MRRDPPHQTIEEVLALLQDRGYDAKRTTAKGFIIKIFTEKSRLGVVQELLSFLEGSVVSPKKETVVLITGTKIQIVVKPKGKQGFKSAGLENEQAIISAINQLCQNNGAINIRFIGSNGPILECRNVTRAIGTGYDTKGKKKADLILVGNSEYPISLKKLNAEYWESADSYIGELARKIIDSKLKRGLVELQPVPGVQGAVKLSKEIIFKANSNQTKEVVFGSDILGKGAVIQETFSSLQFIVTEDDWYEIKVKALYKTVKDVLNDKEHNVWFLIRNDKTRNSKTIGYRGLRALAVYYKRIKRHLRKT